MLLFLHYVITLELCFTKLIEKACYIFHHNFKIQDIFYLVFGIKLKRHALYNEEMSKKSTVILIPEIYQ